MAIYGFCRILPLTAINKLNNYACKLNKTIAIATENKIVMADVIVFLSLDSLYSYYRQHKPHSNIVVFDAVLRLQDIQSITILDMVQDNQGVFYKKQLMTNKRYKKPFFGKPTKQIKIERQEIIKKLIKINTEGRFINIYNQLIYNMPIITVRDSYKRALLSYLFKDLSWSDLEKIIDTSYRKSKLKTAYVAVKKYFETENGKNLLAALAEIKPSKRLDNQLYVLVGKKYNIDPYELRYFTKMYRKSVLKVIDGKAAQDFSKAPGNRNATSKSRKNPSSK